MLSFTVTRTGDLSGSLTVDYQVVGSGSNGATAGEDSTPAMGTVTFLAGEATAVLELQVIDDALAEATEGVAVVIMSGPGYQVDEMAYLAEAEIVDDDAGGVIAVGPGNDTLDGSAGIDFLNGSGGDDRLVGLAGADTLNGGAGFDMAFYGSDATFGGTGA